MEPLPNLITEAGVVVTIDFWVGIDHLDKFGHGSPVCRLPDFFKGRFPLGNQHQLSNHPRWALRNDHR